MTWLCMKFEVILLSASMFSERCTMLCSLDEKYDRQKKFGSRFSHPYIGMNFFPNTLKTLSILLEFKLLHFCI